MFKYTAEDKLKAVERYLNGRESADKIAKSLETDHKAILKWVKQYEYNGVEAFTQQPYTNYTLTFKMDVLNFMIENGTSLTKRQRFLRYLPLRQLVFGESNMKHKD